MHNSYLLSGGHHHPPLDGVDGVSGEAGGDGDHPAQQEGVHPGAGVA